MILRWYGRPKSSGQERAAPEVQVPVGRAGHLLLKLSTPTTMKLNYNLVICLLLSSLHLKVQIFNYLDCFDLCSHFCLYHYTACLRIAAVRQSAWS